MTIRNHTVAFLDILGFKQSIEKVPLQDLANRYEYIIVQMGNWLNQPLPGEPSHISLFPAHPQGSAFCRRHIFSDSIILLSIDDTLESCLKLLLYAWKFTQMTLGTGVPLRGAITHGEMYINEKQSTFLGKALTNAYLLERNQQWIGVAIDPSVFVAHPGLKDLFSGESNALNDIFFEYEVPMKDKSTCKMRTFNWRWNLVVKDGTKSLFPSSNDHAITEKQKNSLKYAQKIVSKGRLYPLDQSSLPHLLRTFYVGDSEPPFKHGDDL